jgi:hypothetical protein
MARDPSREAGLGQASEERIEVKRYLEALPPEPRAHRRHRCGVTLGVLIASLLVPKKYEATARLALAEQAS